MTNINEYRDEGVWEIVVDFTKFKKTGVPAKEVLKVLHKTKK